MSENNSIGNHKNKPIENHETAPLADIEKTTTDGKVPIPREEAVDQAREWVDINEK
ncbi:MAG: DUF3787 domain-containing protein [Vallitaleaceae bacterium]|nr:DUF3787 domain-containing protein [Vallitaleaceae bacterium]